MAGKSKKNPLTIRLTESAVFLRSDGSGGRHRAQEARPSMLRGLLILDLAKPTKISSIELELLAKTTTSWPEGIGARRTEITEEHTIFHASTVYFRAGNSQARRNASIGPGAVGEVGEYDSDDQYTPAYTPRNREEPAWNHEPEAPHEAVHGLSTRRLSADSSFFQRVPLSHEEFPLPPTPPYSPFDTHPPSPSNERPPIKSAQTLEDFRNSLNAGLRNGRSRSTGLPSAASAPGSIRSFRPDLSLSRRPSIEDVPENEPGPSTPRNFSRGSASQPTSRPGSRPTSRPPSPPSTMTARAGSRSRFSLSSVSSVLMDAVRSSSPKAAHFADSREQPDDNERTRRGRTQQKGKAAQSPRTSMVRAKSKERSTLSKIGDILKLDHEDAQAGDGWKEFKKGTYTYPISFTIPANSPPSLRCNHGTVVWRLRATAHRPGAFKSKLAAAREVIVITYPTEEATEDTENIIVERHWDQQLQYLISVSGRSFYIGGMVPITFTLLPLMKVKIHRISVLIEERVDYYTHMRRIARTDPLTRVELLNIKIEHGKGHILPLESDDVDAFKNSPLFALVTPDDDPSEMASSLMGPGPWTFHQELKLPTSCSVMRITNKNRKSNVVITHQLKCVMRVERGDDLHLDPKTGKRKLFDIVVQTPIQILSCRCNPEWSSLPAYSEAFDDTCTAVPKCPCDVRRAEEVRLRVINRPTALDRMASRLSSDSAASAAETTPVTNAMRSLHPDDSLHGRSNQYERLISGQESEMGEAPPTYTTLGMHSLQSH